MSRRALLAVGVLGVLVGACSSSGGGEITVTTEPPRSIATAGEVAQTTTVVTGVPVPESTDAPEPEATTTSTTETATSTAATTAVTSEPEGFPVDDGLAVWAEAWRLAGRADTTVDDLAEVATAEVAQVMKDLIAADPGVSAVLTSNAVPDLDGRFPNAMFVDDCLHIDPSPNEKDANWYSGTVTNRESGELLVTNVQVASSRGCVPRAIALEVLEDYRDASDAIDEYWSPADPDHPRVAETTTGEHLEFLRAQLAEHRADGVELRNDRSNNPEIILYRPGEVTILDCAVLGRGFGLFSVDTGERLPGFEESEAGTLSLTSSVMKLVDGRWKNSDSGGFLDADCSFPPTSDGVVVV